MDNDATHYKKTLLHCAVAAALGASGAAAAVYTPRASAQETPEEAAGVEEVVVTGSRIVRRDLEVNSPLLTVDRELFEDSAFISIEQALNDLPQFMVGGVNMSASAVTSLQAANGLEGGLGTGDAFNMSLLPNNAQAIGIVVPGAANVNLRGLGANRSLTLIDGHRAMPLNASMIVDLNTIPSIAIGSMEVITGGASAVYGADALAGVTNIKFRDDFEGVSLRVRGGTNEVGDGDEHQIGALIGANFAGDRGNVMIGMEYSKRRETLWRERDFFREVMDSPYSDSGDLLFGWDPYYSSGGQFGTQNAVQGAWNGNAPSTDAILQIFSDRTCTDANGQPVNCIASTTNAPFGGGWYFNADGTIYTRSSQTGGTGGIPAVYYGPQRFNGLNPGGPTIDNPFETTCTFTTGGTSADPNFPNEPCNPTLNRVDYGRWLSSPRDAYNMFGRATFDITDGLELYSNFHFASSKTYTRREPAPILGGFNVVIPFDSQADGDDIYLPSLDPATGQTVSSYLPGGIHGTSCAPTGGCTMSQVFPVPPELRALLESRPDQTWGAGSPFEGLSRCHIYNLLPPGSQGPGVLENPATGALYSIEVDPNTGKAVSSCGPNSGWQLNWQPGWMPPRGTENTAQLYQIAVGLRGDLGFSDWTWDLYTSQGASETQTKYIGFLSINTYQRILSAPNYGKGYSEVGPASKYLTCTSGLSPFDRNLVVSQDCIEAIIANTIDRNTMTQSIYEFSAQGHVADLPGGEMRAAFGATYRTNAYKFTPDALLDRTYLTDFSAGAFGSGSIDEEVSVREVYGELLVPLIRDLRFARSLELELGARHSEYTTGQNVDTYKILASYEPLQWLRFRGGYNRAERAPNMSELYATPNGSAQFGSFPNDPCRNNPNGALVLFPGPTPGSTLNNTDTTDPAIRAQLQEMCSAHINLWGGNDSSDFHADPNEWNVGGGGALVVGNPNLRNEKGDTWTWGAAFRLPLQRPALRNITGTVDWYKARVSDPIAVLTTATIVNTCYNINGLNPTYSLDDPNGYCSLIERDPVDGAIERVYLSFDNQDRLEISGVDVAVRWSAPLVDLGFDNAPGTLSINTNMNFLLDQIQRFTGSTDEVADYAGYNGASRFRVNTGFTYSWNRHRVTLVWTYRDSTKSPTTWAVMPNDTGTTGPELRENPLLAGYKSVHLFNLTAGTQVGAVNLSLSVNNLFDKKPRPGGYQLEDPRRGFGTFSPFDDLVGRRYSFNMSVDF
ncbi:MAG TPA: TonB-dependent receptor [Gammaproteobacteria bacterium]